MYLLPFTNAPVHITQGYNGRYSHKQFELGQGANKIRHDDRFSLDFELDIGTPVCAARTGRIIFLYQKGRRFYTGLDFETGLDIFTNQAYLEHEDGTFTLYSHLQEGSIQKRRGDLVEQGEFFAQTGLSGWIGPIPHLHFAAGRFAEGKRRLRRTFPIVFNDYDGRLEDIALEETFAL